LVVGSEHGFKNPEPYSNSPVTPTKIVLVRVLFVGFPGLGPFSTPNAWHGSRKVSSRAAAAPRMQGGSRNQAAALAGQGKA
jgi:hypothetical protein